MENRVQPTVRVRPVFRRAYVVQYVSLMIIVMSFVIGAFAGHKIERARQAAAAHSSAQAQPVLVSEPEPFLKSELHWSDLFQSDGGVNRDYVHALAEILRNHDLNIEVTLSGAPDLDSGLNASRRVKAAFDSENIPTQFREVYVADSQVDPSGMKARVNFKEWHLETDGESGGVAPKNAAATVADGCAGAKP